MGDIRLVEAETDRLVAWAVATLTAPGSTFQRRRAVARRLGAHVNPETGLAEFGFWAPELSIRNVPPTDVHLEVLTPLEDVDLAQARQSVVVRRERVPLRKQDDRDYWWAAVDGLVAGTRERLGSLYHVVYRNLDGSERIIRDLLPYSLPYGAFAPAELYDIDRLDRERGDREHFTRGERAADGVLEVGPPSSILELHIPTATTGGTVADLARAFERLGSKVAAGEPLSPAEELLAGYEAIQPLPVDPTIELREAPPVTEALGFRVDAGFFLVTDVVDEFSGEVGVTLKRPDTQNWGYDNVILGASATNPALLETLRPDELVDLAVALHTFPTGPISLIYDVVYGHADNQATELLNGRFFKGPNMYGQDLNHQDPTVRAMLLEMQRRKVNTGCDGVRVDGAQDFKFYDPRTGEVGYDDEYLEEMSGVVQEVAGQRRRMWMIFEDGRPWPDEGWETSSTYRDVIERQPEVFQWGPLIFAHNTPMLEGFWREKWWRVEEIARHGDRWISGCGNHDTLRRGNQVDPSEGVNHRLGATLPEIHHAAYDNPAVTLFVYGFLPGVPMDFLNATARTPWGFVRNTDDRYGVKVAVEELGFLDWQVDEATFAEPEVFARTKRHGFATLDGLRAFMAEAAEVGAALDHHLDGMAAALSPRLPGLTGRRLVLLARAFLEDCHDLCNVGRAAGDLDAEIVGFDLTCRRLRAGRRWLADNLGEGDTLSLAPSGPSLAWGTRTAPDRSEEIGLVVNLEGDDVTAETATLLGDGWQPLLATPALPEGGSRDDSPTLTLPDGAGMLLTRTERSR